MAVENLTATSRSELPLVDNRAVTARPGMNVFESTVTMTAAASDTSTYWMARLPMNARLSGLSQISHDDLASTGAPTIDVGLTPVGSNFTFDVDAINDGIDVATAAANGLPLIKDPANIGKYVWELAGESTNPGGYADLLLTLDDADCNTGGDISVSVVYIMD